MAARPFPDWGVWLADLISKMAYQELIPDEILDGQLTFRDLTVISKHILEWSDKARVLGLSESEIENIREDNKNSRSQP